MSEFKRVTGTIPAKNVTPQHYKIVPMSADNVDQIVEIEKECFSTPWSRQMLLDELDNLSASYIAAEAEDGTIIGYAGLTVVLDEGYINNIAVRKDYRRMGVAANLLDVFLRFGDAQQLAFLTLEVRKSNVPAIAMYLKHGFQDVGSRKNYYDDPKEDAILMTHFFKKVEE